jgi:hypothetical protein
MFNLRESIRATGILALSTVLAAQATAQAPRLVEFKIAGGQTVQCPATDAGPLPARSGPYQMEVAAFMTGKAGDGKPPSLTFTFGLSVENNAAPARIRVEDVTDEAAILLVDDREPKLVKKYWRGDAAPTPVSEQSTPWIFDPKTTIRVFKVTISARNAPDVILYQPAWYSAQAKRQIASRVKNSD